MIIIHAYMRVQPNQREAFLEHVQDLIKHSKEEAGNNSYHLYEDATQSNLFVMIEEWKNHEAIKVHEETAHFQAFLQVAKTMLSEPLHVNLYEANKL